MKNVNQRLKTSTFSLIILYCVLSSTLLSAQGKFTISGTIRDAKTGETMIGATVYVKEAQTGATSNEYGFYSISLPAGEYSLIYSYISYLNLDKKVNLSQSTLLDVELSEEALGLQEVVISGEKEEENPIRNIQMSVNRLDIKTIQKIPAFLGEVDIVRSIQLLPGVSTVGDGATGFNVRGGGVDQNLVLLDEAPVYNSSHLFGFFSVFNPDAVKDVKLLKGGIPAQYGGRLSSLLDVRMKEGNSKQFAASGGIGAIFSRLTLEAPLIKDRASFIVAGRRSYIDVLAKPFLAESASDSKFNFYDLTLKANYKINENNKIFLSGYFGRDVFGAANAFDFVWGNSTASLRWNHLFSQKLFSNFTLFYSDYDYRLGFGSGQDTFDWRSKILNYSFKPEFTWFASPKNTVTFGGQMIYYNFKPGSAVGTSTGEKRDISLENRLAMENAVYVGNEQTLSSQLSLQYGLRWSFFNYLGEGTAYEYAENTPVGERRPVVNETVFGDWSTIKSYNYAEPRFAVKYQINGQNAFKASYNRMVQYIHLVSNTAAATPLDVWTPSTNNLLPQLADQVALGYARTWSDKADNDWEFSFETYYKDYQNVLEYIDGADLLLNEFLEGDLLRGVGRAYGAEFFLKKGTGRFNGWLSYTLARSERKVEGLNNNEWFANRFDQTHRLNVVAFYELNERWSFSADFILASGTPFTTPTGKYSVQGYTIPHNVSNERNNARNLLYHRLDIAATLQGKKVRKSGKPRKNEDFWVFSIFNLYNHRNPYSTYFRPDPQNQALTQAVRFSVIGSFIPSVAYNFKF
jgi:hypothetical protein